MPPMAPAHAGVASEALPPDAVARALPDQVPENAPAHCPGTESEQAGRADACEGCPNQNACKTAPKGPDPDLPQIRERMRAVDARLLVLSGKGGVGKSTFTAQLAWALASDVQRQTAVMDIDVCGPSIPTILGLQSQYIHASASGWSPVYVSDNLSCMSIEFLLPSSEAAIIWRGPKKNGLIKQFLKDVDWTGGLADEADGSMVNPATGRPWIDYLLVDTPPGTSDEHISLMEAIHMYAPVGVLVTTPQAVSLSDNLRSLDFTRKVGLPVLGLIENLSGYVCPHCDECTNVWGKGGGEALAEREHLLFLGRVPIDPALVRLLDDAKEEAASEAAAGADAPAGVRNGGTLQSYASVRRYRASQTYPIFQQITAQVRAALAGR